MTPKSSALNVTASTADIPGQIAALQQGQLPAAADQGTGSYRTDRISLNIAPAGSVTVARRP